MSNPEYENDTLRCLLIFIRSNESHLPVPAFLDMGFKGKEVERIVSAYMYMYMYTFNSLNVQSCTKVLSIFRRAQPTNSIA